MQGKHCLSYLVSYLSVPLHLSFLLPLHTQAFSASHRWLLFKFCVGTFSSLLQFHYLYLGYFHLSQINCAELTPGRTLFGYTQAMIFLLDIRRFVSWQKLIKCKNNLSLKWHVLEATFQIAASITKALHTSEGCDATTCSWSQTRDSGVNLKELFLSWLPAISGTTCMSLGPGPLFILFLIKAPWFTIIHSCVPDILCPNTNPTTSVSPFTIHQGS